MTRPVPFLRHPRVLLVPLALALVLAARPAVPAAADDTSIDRQVSDFDSICGEGGGTPEHYYDFNADGTVHYALVECHGGKYDGWHCDYNAGFTQCWKGLVRPPRTRHPVARPGGVAALPGSTPTPTPTPTRATTTGLGGARTTDGDRP